MIIHPDTELFSGGRTSEFPGRHLLSGLGNKRTVSSSGCRPAGAAFPTSETRNRGDPQWLTIARTPRAASDRRSRVHVRLRHLFVYREKGHPRVPRDSHAITGW